MKKVLTLLTVLISLSVLGNDTLKIGVKEAAPFAIKYDDGRWGGISIDLLETHFRDTNQPYKLVQLEKNTHNEVIDLVANGEVDMFAGDMTITGDRFGKVDFTQPFYVTNTCIATTENDDESVLSALITFKFLKSMLILLLFIIVSGAIMWIVEKEKNDAFDKGIMGIFDGSYFVSATMTTVGYGDVAAKTKLGKVLAFVLMWVSLGVVGVMYGNITTALTVAELDDGINNVSELSKIKVGTIDGTTSSTFLNENDVKYINYNDAEEALEAMVDGELDAFVFDKPILQYYLGQEKFEGIVLSNKEFEEQTYGFVFPKGSKLDDKFNKTILTRIRGNEWQDLLNKYNLSNE
jgi:polar amino acid transport system substrate-binding protein